MILIAGTVLESTLSDEYRFGLDSISLYADIFFNSNRFFQKFLFDLFFGSMGIDTRC